MRGIPVFGLTSYTVFEQVALPASSVVQWVTARISIGHRSPDISTTGWSKRLYAPEDYGTKNTQKYFKQFQSLTMITYLESGIADGVSVSLVSPWPWRSSAKQSDRAGDNLNVVFNFLYCNHQVHRNFLITLYMQLFRNACTQNRTGRGIQYTVKIKKSVWQFCMLTETKEYKTGFTLSINKFV
jgi:hypothetical protein